MLQDHMFSEPDWDRRFNGGHQSLLFEYGPDVCKVYSLQIGASRARHLAIREARALKLVEAFDDVPAPRLLGLRLFKPGWGVVMTRIQGRDFGRILRDHPEAKSECMRQMARLHVALHRHLAPPRLPSLEDWLTQEIWKAGEVDATFPANALLQRLAKMPEGDRLCHGDFHFSNVMGEPGNASIIDWPSAMRGHPAADVCQSWLLMQRPPGQQDAMAYVRAYASESGLTVKDILDWRAIVAGARLADNVPEEVTRLKEIVAEGLSQ
jgi:aminoglycoside phosphotransferase (APT) family kinase protein